LRSSRRFSATRTSRGDAWGIPSGFQGWRMVDKAFALIDRMASVLNRIFMVLACMIMAGLMIIVCVDLTLRYFFNSPLIWGTEVTEILLLYVTFLAAAQVFRDDSHVAVDIFLAVASERQRRILGLISNAMVGLISAILIYYGLVTTVDLYERGVFNPTILETPMALITMIIPIGCIPLFLEALLKFRKTMNKQE
jgi:TRAP-type C4-dicarboxylate transport system permease small subunit